MSAVSSVYCTEHTSEVAIIFIILAVAYMTNNLIGIFVYKEYERSARWMQLGLAVLVGFSAGVLAFQGMVIDLTTVV